MADIVLEGVRKVYPGDVVAVDRVDLAVRHGEFVVLVGPSGCGKSTTLRAIAGLETVSAGTISIGGVVVNDLPPKKRDVAMVFQNYALYPHMSVRQNLSFGLKVRKLPRAEIKERVDHAASALGLAPLLKRRPSELSGGQRQRVALGRALVRRATVCLFDEPLSNLDATLRDSMRAEIRSLHASAGMTSVYVTHDQEEAMTLGDRIVVMSSGRGQGHVEQVGTPLEVFHAPANRFVAEFVGSEPMNFLEGSLQSENGDARFVSESGATRFGLPSALAQKAGGSGGGVTLGFRATGVTRIGGAEANSMAGTITAVAVLGDHARVTSALADGTRVIARLIASPDLKIGETIHLSIQPEHCRLFEQGAFGARL